ncbi:unnamed protein product [Arabidopsis halleri]
MASCFSHKLCERYISGYKVFNTWILSKKIKIRIYGRKDKIYILI